MSPDIRPVTEGLSFAGIARTITCDKDFLSVIKALEESKPGEVLVIQAEGNVAVAGELFATEAKRRKLAGIVIDGGSRDSKQIRKIGFPVWSRFTTPMSGTVNKISETQVRIMCGGVTVEPGAIVFGDDDGIVVLSPEELASVIEKAESIQQKEELAIANMKYGQSLLDMLNFSGHYSKIKNGEDSKLGFTI
jgi:regulator of RNase E activity RraA